MQSANGVRGCEWLLGRLSDAGDVVVLADQSEQGRQERRHWRSAAHAGHADQKADAIP